MKKNSICILRRIYKILLSISIILGGISLIVGCIHIYFFEKNYTRDIVVSTFFKIDIPIYFCLILIIGDIIWEIISPTPKKDKAQKKFTSNNMPNKNDKSYLTLKIILLCVAVTAATVGFLIGGYADVLTKAINICTECIGLG